jgi:glycosyltransferase involved in cell wall biosynthesis
LKVALIDAAPNGHRAPYAIDIAHGLRRAGHQAVAVGPAPWCDALAGVADGLPIDWTPTTVNTFAQRQASQGDLFTRAFAACARAGVDVAHVLYLDGATYALLRADVPRKLAVVATLHWYPFLGWNTRGPREALKGLLTMTGLWGLARRGVNVVVHSARAEAALRRAGVRSVHTIDYPSVADQSRVSPGDRERMRAYLGVPREARLLLCFGGTRHDKGVDLAIAALAGTAPDIHLLVAGLEQDFDRDTLLALAQRHGVSKRLLLQLGHVPAADVAPIFAAADALLLPYRPVFTGQSGPLTIAGALGVPVIAADVPVLAETVAAYEIGGTFEAGNVTALQTVLRGEWPRTDDEATQRFMTATDPLRFAARCVELYESSHSHNTAGEPAQKAAR